MKFKRIIQPIIAVLILLSGTIKAQYDHNSPFYEIFPFTPFYGVQFYKSKPFSPDLNRQDNFKLGQPVQNVGFLMADGPHWISKGFFINPHLTLSQVIPQNVILNDSSKALLRGFNFQINVFGTDVFLAKLPHFHLFVGPDIIFGRYKIKNESFIKKNSYFSPALSVQPWFHIKRVVISAKWQWLFDLSNPKWRTMKGSTTKLTPNHFSNNSTTFLFSLAYLIDHDYIHKGKMITRRRR